MATITVSGNAIIVKSGFTPDEIALVAKYRPAAAALYEGEGATKEPVFGIGVTTGTGSISQLGALFSRTTTDPDGKATITLVAQFPDDAEPKDVVAELVGTAIIQLNKLEATLPAVIEEIAAEKAAILENITVA